MHIGVIGSGMIVEQFMEAVDVVEGASIEALYSRNKFSENTQRIAAKYGIASVYDQLPEMLESDAIDFVYVASPNSLHFEQSLAALEAGKNVICEKPYTSTFKEAKILAEKAKEKNLMIFEGIITVNLPAFEVIRRHLPALGPLRMVQLNYSQYSSRYDLLKAGTLTNIFNPDFSGGALQDINIYNVHFVMSLFGVPIQADYFANFFENGIDTSGIMVMRYPGFIASLVGAKDTRSQNFAIIQGENGYLHIKGGANGLDEVTFFEGQSTQGRVIAASDDKPRLYHEVVRFKQIFDARDFETAHAGATYSAEVVHLIEKARKAAGIYFKADRK